MDLQGRNASLPPAKIVIADDHVLIRDAMQSMLEQEPSFSVLGTAGDGKEAVELCRKACPDVVLMDLSMPTMDGLEATRKLKDECPQTSVLIVTVYVDPDSLLQAVLAGAAGYVLKYTSGEELIDAVKRVLQGEHVLDQDLTVQLLERMGEQMKQVSSPPPGEAIATARYRKMTSCDEELVEPLTAKELEVLGLVVKGMTNRQIAQELFISVASTKVHVRRIISKLGVSDRTQAAARAVTLDLLEQKA